MTLQLGLIPRPRHPALPRLAARATLPEPKPAVDWHQKVRQWPMLANDRYGCCVPAGALHAVQLRMANAWGSDWQPIDSQCLELYKAWAPGFDPDNPGTDVGTDVPTAMAQWSSVGIRTGLQYEDVAWHLTADTLNTAELKLGIEWFGCACLSLNLPITAQAQFNAGRAWLREYGPDAEPGTLGPHFVPVGRYDPSGLWCITWGQEQFFTWGFYFAYCMAVDLTVSAAWLDATGTAPPGLSREQLMVDMQTMAA